MLYNYYTHVCDTGDAHRLTFLSIFSVFILIGCLKFSSKPSKDQFDLHQSPSSCPSTDSTRLLFITLLSRYIMSVNEKNCTSY